MDDMPRTIVSPGLNILFSLPSSFLFSSLHLFISCISIHPSTRLVFIECYLVSVYTVLLWPEMSADGSVWLTFPVLNVD